jgi:hypothetical protein
MKSTWLLALAAAVLMAASPLPAQNTGGTMTNPPTNFKKVSTLVRLPDWLPGLGTLYVDPATLPVGPYLGYNHNGQVVNVIYMIPLKDFEQHKDLNNLGHNIAEIDLKVNHTSVVYNPGHPGMQEPHYHFIEWLITPTQVEQDLK